MNCGPTCRKYCPDNMFIFIEEYHPGKKIWEKRWASIIPVEEQGHDFHVKLMLTDIYLPASNNHVKKIMLALMIIFNSPTAIKL